MPKFKGKKPDPKLSYVQGIKDWQWYVGAGMYIDDIETAIQAKQFEMTKKIINSLFQVLMVLLSLITAAYFYARKMSDDTQKSFDLFTRFFKKGARDSAVIDPGIMKYKEFETLARSTNDMIEARKKIQTEQIESERKYRLIVENINDMIVKLDRHKKLIFASPNYCEIFDRNKEDVLNQPILSILSERNRGVVEKSLNKLDSPPYTSYHENSAWTRYGRRWFAWSNRTIRDDDGRPMEYLSVGRDITEKKQAEDASKENQAWLQNILDSIQAGVIVIDPKTHKIIELNRAALEMLGTKKDQILNTVCHNHICPNEIGMCPVTDLGLSIDQSDRELITSDGTRIPILKTVNPAVINQKTYLIESFLDMRDKKHLEALLIQAQKMEAIGTLAGGIAHDFNNILSGIFGYAQLLDMDIGEQEKAKKHLGRIVKGAQRASELVQQILTFSRQTDHQTLPTTVFVILKEALDLIRSSIPSSIEIKRNIVSKARIMADPTQIHQVIINLCTNAYQSMGKTGGILTINLHEAEIADPPPGGSAGKYLKLEISDTGHGMDEKTTSRIFDPYFTTKKKGKGTGLGLSTVNGIVQKHNGFIRVLSKAGQGSSFQVYLPVFNGERSQKPSKRENIATGSGTVMVVDDETELLNTLNLLLVRIGYTVETFTNGESALNVFKKTPDIFDLVITDMTMPQMTGDKLSSEILKIRPDIPIVICSGYHETFTEKEALKSGIKKFIRKPFRAVEFSKIIQDLIGSS